jgi:HD superfamily phosphohydrolase
METGGTPEQRDPEESGQQSLPNLSTSTEVPTKKRPAKAVRPAQETDRRGAAPAAAQVSEHRRTDRPLRSAPDYDGVRGLSKETLLPVSGLVRLSDRELDVIDHPAFQRLFAVNQLGQTHLVYRGATHSRGQHCVGTLHTAAMMIEALDRNLRPDRDVVGVSNASRRSHHWGDGMPLSSTETTITRLAALLHDIGHLPAGHTIEDELGLRPAHDTVGRMRAILRETSWYDELWLSLQDHVNEFYADEAAEAQQRFAEHVQPSNLRGQDLTATELALALTAKDHPHEQSTPGTEFRIEVCRDLLVNTICADLLDYIHRDWAHIGKPRNFDSRLLDYLSIKRRVDSASGSEENHLVIDLRGGARPRPDAVTAILDLLESRYQLSEIALFHRVKLAAAGMLERTISELAASFPNEQERNRAFEELTRDLWVASDLGMVDVLADRLQARRRGSKGAKRKRLDGALALVGNLRVRQLHVGCFTYYEENLRNKGHLIRERFAGRTDIQGEAAQESKRVAAESRLNALRLLEFDFELPTGSIVMYCPPLKMNAKIAAVRVFVDGHMHALHELDDETAGGHLSAQQRRFRRLWRVTFAVERNAINALKDRGTYELLQRTIETAVLRLSDTSEEIREATASLAGQLLWLKHPDRPRLRLILAQAARDAPATNYPDGAPSLRSFRLDPIADESSAR